MSVTECKCRLMQRRKSYYCQPVSELLCEACLNRPVVTIRRHICLSDPKSPPAVPSSSPSVQSLSTSNSIIGPGIVRAIISERRHSVTGAASIITQQEKSHRASQDNANAWLLALNGNARSSDEATRSTKSSASSTETSVATIEITPEFTRHDDAPKSHSGRRARKAASSASNNSTVAGRCKNPADFSNSSDSSSNNRDSSSDSSRKSDSSGIIERRIVVRAFPAPACGRPNSSRAGGRQPRRRRPPRRVHVQGRQRPQHDLAVAEAVAVAVAAARSDSPPSSSSTGGSRQCNSSSAIDSSANGAAVVGGGKGGVKSGAQQITEAAADRDQQLTDFGELVGNRTEQSVGSSQSLTTEAVLRDVLSYWKLTDGALPGSRQSSSRMSDFQKFQQNPEPLSMVEKAIMDFFGTHKGESAQRVVQVSSSDNDTPGGFSAAQQPTADQPAGSHLLKDSIAIGELSVFDEQVSRQFILPMFDTLLSAFLNKSSTLRVACVRTRCRVELHRRILNRRVIHGSWVKYMVITITGPTMSAIDNCDKMLKKCLQPYRLRRVHEKQTTCCLYLKEEIPDNADLCFSHQRTGVTTTRFGNLRLQSPFCTMKGHGNQGLTKHGRAALSSKHSSNCVSFVYSNALQARTGNVPGYCTGVSAILKGQAMQEQATEKRHVAAETRKKLLLPLSRV